MRLFFALWPPREAAAALHAWAREVARGAGGRATPVEKIHLTLAFLGEVAADEGRKAVVAAGGVRAPAHALAVETAQYRARHRIVWAGPEEMPQALSSLAADLGKRLLEAGFRLEERPFRAHVTLVRGAAAPRELSPLPVIGWPVTEFTLVRSTLDAKGSRYETVARFTLGA
jgi:2'-5' RNA ligase